ncbi:hypothetical protein GALMADRAFT_216152 [Galerina marginata CBS 339.88]|uniref:Uncharacterized protein n=1 Tax=Galerina marginata (strain CBS 339.88) TaxID=685588 RepID=A0A067SA25_GALM3|nr:hypothetical protein GALMADRAFT_216152 [Galerina marginata CBS 339.88]
MRYDLPLPQDPAASIAIGLVLAAAGFSFVECKSGVGGNRVGADGRTPKKGVYLARIRVRASEKSKAPTLAVSLRYPDCQVEPARLRFALHLEDIDEDEPENGGDNLDLNDDIEFISFLRSIRQIPGSQLLKGLKKTDVLAAGKPNT